MLFLGPNSSCCQSDLNPFVSKIFRVHHTKWQKGRRSVWIIFIFKRFCSNKNMYVMFSVAKVYEKKLGGTIGKVYLLLANLGKSVTLRAR